MCCSFGFFNFLPCLPVTPAITEITGEPESYTSAEDSRSLSTESGFGGLLLPGQGRGAARVQEQRDRCPPVPPGAPRCVGQEQAGMEAELSAVPSHRSPGGVPRRPSCPSLPNPLHWGGTRRAPSLGAGAEGGGPAPTPGAIRFSSHLRLLLFLLHFVIVLKGSLLPPPSPFLTFSFQIRIQLFCCCSVCFFFLLA